MNLESISSIVPSVENVSENDKKSSFESLLHDSDYRIIESDMDKEYGKFGWGEYSGDFARPEINESEYLLKGTLRLVQKVVDANSQGTPYDTVFFLDKSARPGAYIYRKIIDVLQDKGYLSEETKLPEIRFMDVGKVGEERKIKSEETARMFREKFSADNLGNKILIVDEFRDTGATLTNALQEFEEIYKKNPEHIFELDSAYQFNENKIAPFWYRDSGIVSLVRDALITENLRGIDLAVEKNDDSYLKNFERVTKDKDGNVIESTVVNLGTNLEEIEMLRGLASKIDRKTYIKLFDSSFDNHSMKELEAILRSSIPTIELSDVKNELNAVLNSKIKVMPGSLYDYFEYAGGRLAAPYRENRSSGLRFREMLSTLVKLFEEKLQ